MKKYILFLTIISITIFYNCKKDKPNNHELNEIVTTILLYEQNLQGLERSHIFNVSNKLNPIKIHIPSQEEIEGKAPPPYPLGNQDIRFVLNLKASPKTRVLDSIFLINPTYLKQKKIILSSSKLKINTFSLKEDKEKDDYYCFSKPIYFSDRNFIYVELENFCGGLCGRGKGFVLKKENNKWRVINYDTTWIS